MKTIIFLLTVLSVLPVSAQTRRAQALGVLSGSYSVASTKHQDKAFAFYENCERMPATIRGADPIDGHTRRISVEIYRTRPVPDRAVLILPPTGGKNRLDEKYAEELCRHGIEAWILVEYDRGEKDYTLTDDLLSHDEAGLRGISAIRQVLNHVPAQSIGILGTSAGGILGSAALAVEPRLSVGVFIAAGANIPGIVLESDLPRLRALRQSRMAANGWTRDEYYAALEESVLLDPILFEQELRQKTVGVVIATDDKTVPTEYQEKLEEISDAKRIFTFDGDHVDTILMTTVLVQFKVLDFFKDNL